ncbi:MAG: response regulator [Bdellovibrionota bacterium]
MNALNILLIEDNADHAYVISRYVRDADPFPINLVHEEGLFKGLNRLIAGRFDAILLDLRLPDSDFSQTLPTAIHASHDIPIIVLSTLEDKELAIKTVHDGAQDYLCKANLSSELLVRTIYSAIERKQAEAKIKAQIEQKQVLFDLSQYAMSEHDISHLINRAIALTMKTLEADSACVLEKTSDEKFLILKAELGWTSNVTENKLIATTSTLTGSTQQPTIISNLSKDSKLSSTTYIQDQQAQSGIGVIIYGKNESIPYGALECFTKLHRIFSDEDVHFLQAVANTLAAAILRHQLEEELRQRISELDTAHRRKDEFLATLSHELRTPLNVISGYVELLKSEGNSPDFLSEAISTIESNVNIETQLVCDTLDMAQIITGKMKFEIAQFDFNAAIESALDSIKLSARNKNITIEKDMPPCDNFFIGDQTRIRQMVWNILINAVKFTPNGGRIVIKIDQTPTAIKLSIADTGIGIASESLPYVFERFWQEDAGLNRRFMGLGLGLGIVRHIAELHGGTVDVASDGRDKGTQFTIRLPISSLAALPQKTQALSNSYLKPQPSTLLSLKDLRILVIEDSEDSLFILEAILKKSGATVTACSSPQQGLIEARSGQFDLIISDIGMPVLDGYQLIQQLREWENSNLKKNTPAIALTAYGNNSDIKRALAEGFQLHLSKPIDVTALKNAIITLSRKH